MSAIPPPIELKLMVKRSQYKSAKSARQKELITQQAKVLMKRSLQHA